MRPVLYLDVDDVLLDWGGMGPRAAPGAREFLLWALEHYEVRWLTYWAPDGTLAEEDATVLGVMLNVPAEVLLSIQGLDWRGGRYSLSPGATKLDGIAWLEHLVLGRPFLWVEDSNVILPGGLFRHLSAAGFAHCWKHVDTSQDPMALRRLHEELMRDQEVSRAGGEDPEDAGQAAARTGA